MEEIKDKKDFYKKTKDKKSLVFFTMHGLCPCVMTKPVIEELEDIYDEIDFYEYKVKKIEDLDGDELLNDFSIRPFPTVLYLDNSQIKYRLIGDGTRKEYRNYLKKLIGGL